MDVIKCTPLTTTPIIEQEIETKIDTNLPSAISIPELKSEPSTATHSEPAKTDTTPTAIYFQQTNTDSYILNEDADKMNFIQWSLNYVIDKPDTYDIPRIAGEIVDCHLEDDPIITRNDAMISVYEMLKIYGIKYRKLLNPNEDIDL